MGQPATTDRKKILIGDGTPRTVPDLTAALDAIGCDVVSAAAAAFIQALALRNRPAAIILGSE